VPGQHYYQRSRRAVLQGVDAIVFVADSHPARDTQNRESLADLHLNLAALGLTPEARRRLPWVVQYNKRDLPAALPLEHLRAVLNPGGAPEFLGIASQGKGVNETLKAACKLALARLASDSRPASAAVQATGVAPVVTSAAVPTSGVAGGSRPR